MSEPTPENAGTTGNSASGNTSATATATKPALERSSKRLPPWNVVLLNDDDHTYEYVIVMVQQLFSHSTEKAFEIAKAVDKHGRAVCLTTHKELAELKRDQVHGFGGDKLIDGCKGSMSAIIEPAEFGGEDEDCGDEGMKT